MAVKAVLQIEGKKFNIQEFNYKLEQPANITGYPCGIPFGGKIILTLESDKDTLIYDWTKSHDVQKEGVITFYKQDGMSKFKELKFQEAYCLLHDEQFTSRGEFAMRYTIEISPGNVNYNGSNFTKNWSKPQVDMKNASTFVEEEEDKEKKVILAFNAKTDDVKNGKFGYDKFDKKLKENYTGKDFSNLENEYKPIQVYGEKYFPVWVSMRKGQTITLNLEQIKLGNVRTKNYKLFNEIKFEANADFTFEPANLKDAREVHITCNNSGNQTQIKVEADGETVGAINFFYPEPKEVKVRWVIVNFNKGDRGIVEGKVKTDEILKEYLKKAFNPGLIDIKIINESAENLDVTISTTNLLEKAFIDRAKMNLEAGKKDSIKQTDANKTNLIATLNSLHLSKQNRNSNEEIYLYLTNLKSGSQKESATDSEKIEISSNNGATYNNVCMMFLGNDSQLMKTPEEIPHEVMHAAGLPHTFIDEDVIKPKKHTFKIGNTKNYMDYNNTKETTFFWQWQQLH